MSVTAAPDTVCVLITPVRFREHTYTAFILTADGHMREHYRAGSFRQCLNAARSFFGIRAHNGITA